MYSNMQHNPTKKCEHSAVVSPGHIDISVVLRASVGVTTGWGIVSYTSIHRSVKAKATALTHAAHTSLWVTA